MTSVSPISLPLPSPQPTTTAAAAAAETASTTEAVRMAEFRACSPLVKAGVVLNVAAFVALWLALLAPYWLVNEQFKLYLGILYGCQNGNCVSSDPLSWQVALAGLEVCGVAFGFPSLVFSLRFVFAPATSCKNWIKVTTGLLAFAAALFILIGVIVCATKKDDAPGVTFDLGWAFAIGVVTGVLYISTATCFLLDTCL